MPLNETKDAGAVDWTKDVGAVDWTKDVGAVDWLKGPLLLSGPLKTCDGSDGTSPARSVGWLPRGLVSTVGRNVSLGRRIIVASCMSSFESLVVSCLERSGIDRLV